MVLRRNLWDPSAIDGSGTEGVAAPDGILFPDHGAFQSDATAAAASASDWSGVAIDVDFVDHTLTFSDTTTELTAPPDASSPDDAAIATVHNLGPAGLDWRVTPDFDDDPGWVPGVITQPSSEQTSHTTDDGIAAPDSSSPADAAITTVQNVQNVGPAGLDWRVTPDFDNDPGWVPPPDLTRSTAESVADASSATTDVAPAAQDDSRTLSSTFADLSAQYPGELWPANWWLL